MVAYTRPGNVCALWTWRRLTGLLNCKLTGGVTKQQGGPMQWPLVNESILERWRRERNCIPTFSRRITRKFEL